ncbi:hypothetical protein ACJRO7_009974 [Eucalyptus globulus]|uniref:non-specific serine/threonine protein kinase n=1 Tax=Eucalyptus globulus TaxID=34317 RepID=A0ABD3LAH8_EUCGL
MDLTMSCSSLSLLFLISLHTHFLVSASGEFPPFRECAPFDCGEQQISYPFRCNEQPSYCGYPGYELHCDGDSLTLSMASLKYQVIHVNRSAKILEVLRTDISEDICLRTHVDTTLDLNLFNYTSSDLNSTLFFGCGLSLIPRPYPFFCPPFSCHYFAPNVDLAEPLHKQCKFSVLVPISREALGLLPPHSGGGDLRAVLSKVLNEGFEITWIADTSQCENCNKSGGRCGYGWTGQEFNCFCPDGVYSTTCGQQGMHAYSPLTCGFQLVNVLP